MNNSCFLHVYCGVTLLARMKGTGYYFKMKVRRYLWNRGTVDGNGWPLLISYHLRNKHIVNWKMKFCILRSWLAIIFVTNFTSIIWCIYGQYFKILIWCLVENEHIFNLFSYIKIVFYLKPCSILNNYRHGNNTKHTHAEFRNFLMTSCLSSQKIQT